MQSRKLAAMVIASSVFGGTVGALATAAVQSEASPGAIAAAVQHVQDTNAERTLNAINQKLGAIDHQLTSPEANSIATVYGQLMKLTQICQNTSSGFNSACF